MKTAVVENMQAVYPKKLPNTHWDPVLLNYPVRKFPKTEKSSEAISRQWRPPPETVKTLKSTLVEEKEYSRNYSIHNDLTRTQSQLDYGFKSSEDCRFNKHTSCDENMYIYPPCRKLSDRTPAHSAHGTTEMQSVFTQPVLHSRLITNKDQFKHPSSLPLELPQVEPVCSKIEPLYTTHEGFEKLLDPYLSTNKLHHRPFTAEQLSRPSNTKDILTYYTYSNTPWVRSPKPNLDEWRLPLSKKKSVYDREKFKYEFREIRAHNKLNWVPRALITETEDKFISQTSSSKSKIHNYEEDIRNYYQRSIANFRSCVTEQAMRYFYKSENSHFGSGRPVCSAINQYTKNMN